MNIPHEHKNLDMKDLTPEQQMRFYNRLYATMVDLKEQVYRTANRIDQTVSENPSRYHVNFQGEILTPHDEENSKDWKLSLSRPDHMSLHETEADKLTMIEVTEIIHNRNFAQCVSFIDGQTLSVSIERPQSESQSKYSKLSSVPLVGSAKGNDYFDNQYVKSILRYDESKNWLTLITICRDAIEKLTTINENIEMIASRLNIKLPTKEIKQPELSDLRRF